MLRTHQAVTQGGQPLLSSLLSCPSGLPKEINYKLAAGPRGAWKPLLVVGGALGTGLREGL